MHAAAVIDPVGIGVDQGAERAQLEELSWLT